MAKIKKSRKEKNKDTPAIKLESCPREQFGDEYYGMILEQWKTCVDYANANSEKRSNMNSLYITINTAIMAVISFGWDNKSLLLSVIGLVICGLWLVGLKSHKQMSSNKYEVVNEIEKMLPLAPCTYERANLTAKYDYVGQIKIERVLPIAFIVVYAISILWPILDKLVDLVKNVVA